MYQMCGSNFIYHPFFFFAFQVKECHFFPEVLLFVIQKPNQLCDGKEAVLSSNEI